MPTLKESYDLNDPAEYLDAMEKHTRNNRMPGLWGLARKVWDEMGPKEKDRYLLAASPMKSRVRQDRFGNLNVTFWLKRVGKIPATVYSDGSTTWMKTDDGDNVWLEPKDAATGIVTLLLKMDGALDKKPKVVRRRPQREVVLGGARRVAARYLKAVRVPRNNEYVDPRPSSDAFGEYLGAVKSLPIASLLAQLSTEASDLKGMDRELRKARGSMRPQRLQILGKVLKQIKKALDADVTHRYGTEALLEAQEALLLYLDDPYNIVFD